MASRVCLRTLFNCAGDAVAGKCLEGCKGNACGARGCNGMVLGGVEGASNVDVDVDVDIVAITGNHNDSICV